jgi:Family of unknown function (DUF6262)
MPADNTRYLVAAARQRAEHTRGRAVAAIRRMDATGRPVNFNTLAQEARVSRSWLYAQPDLRTEVQRLRDRHQPASATPATPDRQRASTASLLRRLDAATSRIQRLEQDNQQLRHALAEALGAARTARVVGQTPATTRPNDTPPKLLPPHRPTPAPTTPATPSTTHRRRSTP